MSDNEENGAAGDGFHSEDGSGRGGEIDDHRDSESKVGPFSFWSYYCVSLRNWIWLRCDTLKINLHAPPNLNKDLNFREIG